MPRAAIGTTTKDGSRASGTVLATPAAASGGQAAFFFQVRLGALVINPFLIALVATRMRFTCPLGRMTRTDCRLGKNRRLVIAVTWVPIPPFFLALPERQM